MMAQYRRKPYPVEAVQWFPGVEHPSVMTERQYLNKHDLHCLESSLHPDVNTRLVLDLDSDRWVLRPGVWIVTYEDGKVDGWTDDDFRARFEPVSDSRTG